MSVRMIQDRLASYECRSTLEEEQALREITQEILIAALGRTDFFQKCGFQGGTCLRVFHGLSRFSEDLDFALLTPDATFMLKWHLEALTREAAAYGYDLSSDDRSDVNQAVRTAFVKDDSLGRLLQLSYRPASGPLRKIRIKLEVDTNPPAGASYETRYLDFPYAASACLFDLPSLFAGKMHALLCREYLKGRDWYDFIWYTARKTPVNHALLSSALNQLGPWRDQHIQTDRSWCVQQLRAKIQSTDFAEAAADVRRFVKPNELPSLSLWGRDLFLAQCERLD